MLRLVCLLFFLADIARADEYLDEIEDKCYSTNKTYICAKYKFFKFIDGYSLKDFDLTSDSSLKLVNLPDANISDSAIFPKSRHYTQEDTEFGKIYKFLQRQADKFFNKQGLAIELPEEAKIVEEEQTIGTARGKKKKGLIILPILILLKLFKIKMIVSLILGVVLVIKKMLIIGAFILPGVVAAIKAHCKSSQYHVVPYHVEEDHFTHDHEHDDPSGYGFSGYGSDKHHYWDRINRKKYSYL